MTVNCRAERRVTNGTVVFRDQGSLGKHVAHIDHMRCVICVLAGLVCLTFHADSAGALSCALEPVIVAPESGAAGVPLSPTIAIRFQPYEPEATDITLLDDSDNVLDMSDVTPTSYASDYQLLRPSQPLSPNRTYRITYNRFGTQGYVHEFSTGNGSESAGAITLESVRIEIGRAEDHECRNDAKWVWGIGDARNEATFDYDRSDEHIVVFAEFRWQDEDAPFEREFLLGDRMVTGPCSSHFPTFDGDGPFCVRLRGFDAIGNEITSEEVCTGLVQCVARFDDECDTVRECGEPGGPEPGPGGGAPGSDGGCDASGGGGVAVCLLLLLRRRRIQWTARA